MYYVTETLVTVHALQTEGASLTVSGETDGLERGRSESYDLVVTAVCWRMNNVDLFALTKRLLHQLWSCACFRGLLLLVVSFRKDLVTVHGEWCQRWAMSYFLLLPVKAVWALSDRCKSCSDVYSRKGGQRSVPWGHSSAAVWESRWPSWAVRPNEPSGFRGRKAILNHASALVSACP